MDESALKAALEREERAYEELIQVRASLGTMLAETIKRDRDLSEFEQQKRDLAILTRTTDIRRTELKLELLSRELKRAQEEQRRTAEAIKRATATLEEARRSYRRAARGAREWAVERRRLEELHREEVERLEQLRSEEWAQEKRSEETPGAPSEAAEEPGRVEPQPAVESAQEGVEPRSWWQRIFGGE